MKLIASGDTCSAARVRSPSFSRSSSSTTTTMRPARISSTAPGTSIKGASKVRSFEDIGSSYCRLEPGDKGTWIVGTREKQKRRTKAALLDLQSNGPYNVDSISNPQASKSASGIYLEFLFRRAHSRRRVDRIY